MEEHQNEKRFRMTTESWKTQLLRGGKGITKRSP